MNIFFLDKLSVKARLIGSIVLLLVFMVAAGTGGLMGIGRINNSFSQVYEKNILPFGSLRETHELFVIDLIPSINRLLYMQNQQIKQIEWDTTVKRVENFKRKLANKWSEIYEIKDRSFLDKNEDWLYETKSLVLETNTALEELLTILRTKSIDKLYDFQGERLKPLANEYRDKINRLTEDRMLASKTRYEAAQKEFLFSKRAFLLTILIAVAVGSFIAILLIQSIHDPMSRMTAAIKEIMYGNLNRQLEYDRNDEFGVLITGFNQMVVYLSDLVKQIQHSGIHVTSSITEIAATTKEQEATANEHAATASEIAASSSEIAATASSLLSTMKRVNSLTKNTAFATEEGHKGLLNINNIMMKVGDATGSIVEKLSNLNEKANNVAGVVKTINKVADQTNLLSLNAAIEAEKAGEYGAGFAVVASEIRRLADQTAVATFDIEQMVQDVQSSVSSAVMGIDKFAEDVRMSISEIHESGDQLSGVIEQVSVLMPHIETMNDSIEAQSLGAKQISDAICQLNEAAQQTADSLAQNSNVVVRLQQAAASLQDAISNFKIEN